MWRAVGAIRVFGFGLVFAWAAMLAGCGGGSGDVTGPPGGAGTVDSLVLSLDSADVIVGDTLRISAEARDANGQVVPGVRLSYASSDPAVATVTDDGLVTAVDFGEAEIEVGIAGETSVSARSKALSYSAAMASRPARVMRVSILPVVTIVPGEQTLEPGATSRYLAVLTDIRGRQLPTRPATWSSSDPSVATIDDAGLATAAFDGDTKIAVSFTIPRRQGAFTESVVLHVAVCGGIFRVLSWQALAQADYKTGGYSAAAQATYSVDQYSFLSDFKLERVEGQPGDQSVVWQGKTSGGEVSLNDSLTFPVPPPVNKGVTREIKTGLIEDGLTAVARLTVKRPSEGSRMCTYNFQYGDYFTWSITNNQGAPPRPMAGPTGTALLVGQEVGTTPTDGRWVLGNPGNRLPLPARAFADTSISHYVPGTTIGVSLIIALGGSSATYGTAYLTHLLQGQVP